MAEETRAQYSIVLREPFCKHHQQGMAYVPQQCTSTKVNKMKTHYALLQTLESSF
jgi:hypothetical protein